MVALQSHRASVCCTYPGRTLLFLNFAQSNWRTGKAAPNANAAKACTRSAHQALLHVDIINFCVQSIIGTLEKRRSNWLIAWVFYVLGVPYGTGGLQIPRSVNLAKDGCEQPAAGKIAQPKRETPSH